jgi:cell division protein FtsB
MVRPAHDAPAGKPGTETHPAPEPPASAPAPTPAAAAALGSLADLPVAGLTRRRIAMLLAALVAAWIILLFARQVGEAGEATTRAGAMRTENARLEAEAAALESELALITRQDYIEQVARGYRLGTAKEIPFQLDETAPALPADAPGSASVRLGTEIVKPTPVESWARLLFGGEPAEADVPAPAAEPAATDAIPSETPITH